MSKRLEITVSDEVLAGLDVARGHEPRASFVKRALERVLAERPGLYIPGFGSVPDDEGGRQAVASYEAHVARQSSASPRASRQSSVLADRQARLNAQRAKGKS